MKIRRVKAIMNKEFIHIFRDPRSLALAIAIPLLLLLLFGYALTLDVDRVPIFVLDKCNSPESEDFISLFDASKYFTVVKYVSDYREIETAIDDGTALAALVIPEDFSRKLAKGENADVQLLLDGSDSTTGEIVVSYADAIVGEYSASIALESLKRNGIVQFSSPVIMRSRIWFNEDMESRNFIIPGLIAMIMMVISALLTSLTFSKEWETGTMEQLIATPVKGIELVIGKLIPYLSIGLFDVVLTVALGKFLFNVPIRGSLLLIFLVTLMFLIGAMSLGMLISIITKNQLLSNQAAMIVTLVPSLLLSGLLFSIKSMPVFMQVLCYLVSAKYFITLQRSLFLKATGIGYLLEEFIFLGGFALLMFLLCNVKFKKRLA